MGSLPLGAAVVASRLIEAEHAKSELMLLKRLIYRKRSQHGNSMHLCRLIQLRFAAERVWS